jgi:hypothetical protein
MALTPETEAQILRYHHAERWPVGTIARQLICIATVWPAFWPRPACRPSKQIHRPSAVDPYLPFILETLEQFPRLRASRLYAMVKDRGYPGRPDHFRHLIARHRPRPKRSLSAPAHLAGRTDAGGLGTLRPPRDRPCAPAVDGLRHRPLLVAADLPALLPRRPHGEFPAWPCRGLRCLGRRASGRPLRQSQECGP